ncbi:MAG: hypothetical protein NZT92_16070 [Abditibacteriales bacterium]|nr:hypothetical protein [Abditibacteriales bacterium]
MIFAFSKVMPIFVSGDGLPAGKPAGGVITVTFGGVVPPGAGGVGGAPGNGGVAPPGAGGVAPPGAGGVALPGAGGVGVPLGVGGVVPPDAGGVTLGISGMLGMGGSVMTFGVVPDFAGLLFADVALLVVALLLLGDVDFFVVAAGLLVVFLLDLCCADHAPDSTVSRAQEMAQDALTKRLQWH